MYVLHCSTSILFAGRYSYIDNLIGVRLNKMNMGTIKDVKFNFNISNLEWIFFPHQAPYPSITLKDPMATQDILYPSTLIILMQYSSNTAGAHGDTLFTKQVCWNAAGNPSVLSRQAGTVHISMTTANIQ